VRCRPGVCCCERKRFRWRSRRATCCPRPASRGAGRLGVCAAHSPLSRGVASRAALPHRSTGDKWARHGRAIWGRIQVSYFIFGCAQRGGRGILTSSALVSGSLIEQPPARATARAQGQQQRPPTPPRVCAATWGRCSRPTGGRRWYYKPAAARRTVLFPPGQVSPGFQSAIISTTLLLQQQIFNSLPITYVPKKPHPTRFRASSMRSIARSAPVLGGRRSGRADD